MYFKNDSVYVVGLPTKIGNVIIKPGKVAKVLDFNLITTNEFLTEITEEEYRAEVEKDLLAHQDCAFCHLDSKPKDEKDKKDEKDPEVDEKCKPCYADGKTPSEDDCKICKEKEDKDNQGKDEGSKDGDGTISKLNELKELWNKVSKPAEKAKLAKEIKKLQGKESV